MPRVIHHGLDPDARIALGAGDGGYCAFLGRLRREKGPHVAIDAARAAGLPIRLGGRAALARPRLLRARDRRAAVPAGRRCRRRGRRRRQARLSRRAQALLFPVDWEEPFGLVMIEAMLCGHAGAGVRARLGARDRRGRRHRLHLPRRRRDGGRLRDIGAASIAPRAGRARSSAGRAARMVRDYLALYERVAAMGGRCPSSRDCRLRSPSPTGVLARLPVSGETEPLVLARGNTFCVINQRGDIAPAGARDLGLFHEDTRHLSYLELRVSGGPPVVLSSETSGAATSQVDLTLTDREFGGFLDDPQNFLHIRRKQLLDGGLVEQLVLTNHLRRPGRAVARAAHGRRLRRRLRGARRASRAARHALAAASARAIGSSSATTGSTARATARVVRMSREPTRIDAGGPRWELRSRRARRRILEVVRSGRAADRRRAHGVVPFDVRRRARRARARRVRSRGRRAIACSNVAFETALEHDLEDIDALRLIVDDDGEPLASSAPAFPGSRRRSGATRIITSLELLSVAPSLAVETLRTLAALPGHASTTRGARRSRARSCTSSAAARWRAPARFRTRRTTAASTPRRCGWCCSARPGAGSAIARSSTS